MSVANGMAEVDSTGPSMTDRVAGRAADARESVETTVGDVRRLHRQAPNSISRTLAR